MMDDTEFRDDENEELDPSDDELFHDDEDDDSEDFDDAHEDPLSMGFHEEDEPETDF